MKKNSKKYVKLKFLKLEKFLYIIIFILVITIPLTSVITNAKLSETNILVEELNFKINNQRAVNESYSMQIDELGSLENVQKKALEYGLVYNHEKIKDIKGDKDEN